MALQRGLKVNGRKIQERVRAGDEFWGDDGQVRGRKRGSDQESLKMDVPFLRVPSKGNTR